MSFLGVPKNLPSKPILRTSDIQNYRPGEFLRRFDQQKQSNVSYAIPNGIPQQTYFKDSFIGGLNSYTDDFYKSQVMERAIGGEPVLLNAMANYQPLSADDPIVREQIRQEHVKIMDQKLKEAINNNGGNALQQVKTIIVEPLTDVVEIKQSNVTEGYHGLGKKSSVSSATKIAGLAPGQISGVSIGAPLISPASNSRVQIQRKNSQIINTAGGQQGHSRIQYVPFERKVTELETRQWVEKVPRERVVIEYEDRVMIQQVPVEKTVVDYYAVEHITQYEPKVIEETIIEMVPVEKTYHTTNYVPIQQQIIHYPGENGQAGHSRILYQGPPTQEGEAAIKRQSQISYQPPIARSGNTSVISYENPMIAVNKSSQRRSSRTPNRLPPNKSSTSTSLSKRPVSPINLRPKQVMHHEQVADLNQGFYEYHQQPVYLQSSSPILPFTQQLQQIQQVQLQRPPQVIQYFEQPQPSYIQYVQQPQMYNVQYVQGSYPAPSQVQTYYQIPVQSYNQNYNHQNYSQGYAQVQAPSYQQHQYVQEQHHPAPHEVSHQQHKILRRQNSGISLTSKGK